MISIQTADWQKIYNARCLWVAYSGGLDSSVLLHFIAKQLTEHAKQMIGKKTELPIIKVLHVNHGISAESIQWQLFCQQQAAKLNLPCEVGDVGEHMETGHISEQKARDKRYQVFSEKIQANDLLLQGHHADDQSETLLLRLIRGSGRRGLSAIPNYRAMGKGHLLRPLINTTKAQLEAYANYHGIEWIHDHSNDNIDYDRNFIRHQIMPTLNQRWPFLPRKLLETVNILHNEAKLLKDLAELDLQKCSERKERLGFSIEITTLQQLSPVRQDNLLRYWLNRHYGYFPSIKKLREIAKFCIHATSKQEQLQFSDGSIRRYQQRLYCLPAWPSHDLISNSHKKPYDWNSGEVLSIGSSIKLSLDSELQESLKVVFRVGGERCKPLTRQHSQTLKKLYQEYQLEPWFRDYMPIIYQHDEIVAVGDLFRCSAGFPAVQLNYLSSNI